MSFGFCKDCDCYRRIEPLCKGLDKDSALCLRHAPTPINESLSPMYRPLFPYVKEYYGCGEFVPIKSVKKSQKG